jgi:hypothetical protein
VGSLLQLPEQPVSFVPETIAELQARFPAAIDPPVSALALMAREYDALSQRRHVFDCEDGLRIVVFSQPKLALQNVDIATLFAAGGGVHASQLKELESLQTWVSGSYPCEGYIGYDNWQRFRFRMGWRFAEENLKAAVVSRFAEISGITRKLEYCGDGRDGLPQWRLRSEDDGEQYKVEQDEEGGD